MSPLIFFAYSSLVMSSNFVHALSQLSQKTFPTLSGWRGSLLSPWSIAYSTDSQYDWLGQCKTLMSFSTNHFFTIFAVCFGSLSCWILHCCPRPSISADCLMLLRILRYCSFFMVLFTVIKFPGPLRFRVEGFSFLCQMKATSLWPNN